MSPPDTISRRDDRVFTPPLRRSRTSQRSTPSRPTMSSGTIPPHSVHRTLQSTSHAQQPDDPTRVRFLTPPLTPSSSRNPPTPASPRDPTPSSSTTSSATSPQRPRGKTVPLKGSEYHPASISEPGFHSYTSVYPLLAEAEMVKYFGMDIGVSRRPPDGKSHSFVIMIIISLLTDLIDIRHMLSQVKSNRFWLGGMDYVNTAAAPDVQQEIHTPAASTTSRRWYVVSMGTEVGIFTSWYDLCNHVSVPC